MTYIKLIILYTIVLLAILTFTHDSIPAMNRIIVIGTIRASDLLHTLLFLPWMVIAWLHINKLKVTGRARTIRMLTWLVYGVLLAITLEGVQQFLPDRSFALRDIFFNVLGILLGTFIFLRKK